MDHKYNGGSGGEFDPADATLEKTDTSSTGRGWHVMFTAVGPRAVTISGDAVP